MIFLQLTSGPQRHTSDSEMAMTAEQALARAQQLFRMGRVDEALDEIRAVTAHGDNAVTVRLAEANMLLAAGRLDESIDCAERILAERPGLTSVRANLANLCHRAGRFREAAGHYRRLLEAEPSNADWQYELGVVLMDLGERDDAIGAYRKAVAIDATLVKAWHGIVEASKHPLDAGEVEALLALQEADDLADTDRVRLAFALGRHFERAAQPEDAAVQFVRGNALQRGRLDYDVDNDLRAMQNIREFFDAAFLEKWQEVGLPEETPIFVVGMPRSGTTLVEQILASHSQVFAAGEISLLVHAILERFPIRNGTDYTASLVDATADDLQRVARRYLDGLPRSGERRVTDKLPHNFLNIGMISILFPCASIVHCQRDPRDTCFSIYKHLFGSAGHAYAYDLGELGLYYNAYSAMMHHWEQVLPGRVHTLSYEHLVDEQEQTTRELLEACGLDWEPACLDFHEHQRPIATLSASQVRRPVYGDSVGAWKTYATMLGPLLDRLV